LTSATGTKGNMDNISDYIQSLSKDLNLGLVGYEEGVLTSLLDSGYVFFVLLDLSNSIIYFLT
jgi:hypothetical protein